MNMIQSNAVFDTLFLGSQLQNRLSDFSNYELQIFSYLSCLLSLYEGEPVAFWGYTFIKNDLGSPYSREINDSIEALIAKGSIIRSDRNFLKVSDGGLIELEIYSSFHSNVSRIKFLQAACDSINLISYGTVKDSISKEPILKSAGQQDNRRLLIDNESPAFSVLYDQFEMLKIALENKFSNLVMPAIVWLKYLDNNNKNSNLS
jgi:hypothetical protein